MGATNTVTIFAYGLGMNLGLLTPIIGGKSPTYLGTAALEDYSLSFGVAGHLPNLVRSHNGYVEGVLLCLNGRQVEAFERWLMVPIIYKPKTVRVRVNNGIQLGVFNQPKIRQAVAYMAPNYQNRSGHPNLETLGVMCQAARSANLTQCYQRQLMAWRPNDGPALARWGAPA